MKITKTAPVRSTLNNQIPLEYSSYNINYTSLSTDVFSMVFNSVFYKNKTLHKKLIVYNFI